MRIPVRAPWLLLALVAACAPAPGVAPIDAASDRDAASDATTPRDADGAVPTPDAPTPSDSAMPDARTMPDADAAAGDDAAACGTPRTVVFDPTIPIYLRDANAALGLRPGDTLCMPAGDYGALHFHRLRGTAACPIRVTNCGGLVRIGITESPEHRLNFTDSQHFVLAGDGVPGLEYGIEIDGETAAGGHYHAVMVETGSTDYEIHHVYAHDHGVTVENVPHFGCDRPDLFGDVFTIRNPRIHHLRIRNGQGYGLLIGLGADVELPCGTRPMPAYENVDIHDIDLDTVGREGIHLGHATRGRNVIHHNVVRNAAGGITLDSDTRADVFANDVDVDSVGVTVRGTGVVRIHDNVLASAVHPIQLTGTSLGSAQVFAYQNTLIARAGDAVLAYSDPPLGPHHFVNNLVIAPSGTTRRPVLGFNVNGAITATSIHHNVLPRTVADARFVDAARGDYHLAAGSPAIGAGADLTGAGVDTDRDGRVRRAPFDVGCYVHAPGP